MRLWPWLVLLLAGLPGPAAAAGLADTVARIKPAIVGVGTVQPSRRPPGKFLGTGFVVGDGRHALTTAHSLRDKLDAEHRERRVVLSAAGDTRDAEVVAEDADHDLALLRFQGERLHALKLGDSQRVREGEGYAFTGFPLGMVLGMVPVTHRATVSAITPIATPQLSSGTLDPKLVKRLRDPYPVFQLDGTAYPGNSGSPLYDPDSGAVVGVINKVFVKESKENLLERPSGISYAIPIVHARALLERAGLAP
jgi:S1-C subfamily serine protease